MSDGFQTAVNNQPAPGVAGDFASMNPMYTFDAGPGGLVCGPAGLAAGRFAWVTNPVDADGTPAVANNYGTGPVAGYVVRDQQGLITQYLSNASMITPQGLQATLFIGGDFWAKNDGAAQALPGMKAYASFADGKVTFAATGSPATGASAVSSSIAAGTFSVTGSILNDVLTVTAVGSGSVYNGSTISGSGVASGSKIVSQLTPLLSGEAAHGIGRYYVSIPEQDVASTTVSGTYGILTAGTTTGTFGLGNVLTGSSVVAGTYIGEFISGTGGAGTYAVSDHTVVSSTTISVLATNVETKWYCRSSGLPGEVVKISSQPLG